MGMNLACLYRSYPIPYKMNPDSVVWESIRWRRLPVLICLLIVDCCWKGRVDAKGKINDVGRAFYSDSPMQIFPVVSFLLHSPSRMSVRLAVVGLEAFCSCFLSVCLHYLFLPGCMFECWTTHMSTSMFYLLLQITYWLLTTCWLIDRMNEVNEMNRDTIQ